MADNDWVLDIEPKIYTIVKTRLKTALSSTYPNLLVTQEQKLNDDTNLPSIYIKMLDSYEIGADLNNLTVNAMMITFEVHVTIAKDGQNNGLTGLRKISKSVLDNFKKLRFNMVMRGEITKETSDTCKMISRFRRTIGGNEEINL